MSGDNGLKYEAQNDFKTTTSGASSTDEQSESEKMDTETANIALETSTGVTENIHDETALDDVGMVARDVIPAVAGPPEVEPIVVHEESRRDDTGFRTAQAAGEDGLVELGNNSAKAIGQGHSAAMIETPSGGKAFALGVSRTGGKVRTEVVVEPDSWRFPSIPWSPWKSTEKRESNQHQLGPDTTVDDNSTAKVQQTETGEIMYGNATGPNRRVETTEHGIKATGQDKCTAAVIAETGGGAYASASGCPGGRVQTQVTIESTQEHSSLPNFRNLWSSFIDTFKPKTEK